MAVVVTAIAGSAVVGGVASIISSKNARKGIEKGAAAEKQISDSNIALQKELADEQRKDFEPWRKSGIAALNKLNSGVASGAFDLGKFNTPTFGRVELDPGFDFRKREGVKARDQSASARGRLNSGAHEKALERYGQDYASNEYSKAYGRTVDKYNRDFDKAANDYALDANAKSRKFNILSGLSTQGQQAASRQAGATSQLSTTTGNILANSGRSQNNAYSSIGNMTPYNDIATGVNKAAQNWLTFKAG